MKDKNKLILSIVAVLAIIIIVAGATFAYWSWVSNSAQQTSVSFTIEDTGGGFEGPDLDGPDGEPDGIPDTYARLEGNGTTTAQDLVPTTCTDTARAIKKTVTITYINQTENAVTINATLSVTDFEIRSLSYKPSADNLGYLKYALTEGNTANCTTSVAKQGSFNGVSGFTTVNASTLPTLFTQQITVPANTFTEQTKTYTLWIWLDSGYNHENEGNVNNDPMQGLTFTTQWSGTVG